MPDLKSRRSRPSPQAAHDLAEVEQHLRSVGGIRNVDINVGEQSARLYFDSWEPNEHTRGSAKTAVITMLADSEYWHPVTLHDDIEQDDGLLSSALTVRKDGDADEQ